MESIRYVRTGDYYDLEVPGEQHYAMAGVWHHNTLKTCTILDVLMLRAATSPGLTWYLWRSTRSLLTNTVLQAFEDFVLPKWQSVRGMRLLNTAARAANRSEYVFENGSVFIPEGLDKVSRGQSASCAGGYLAEATELDSLEQITALAGMLRQPGAPFHQLILDVNPGPPNHFINRRAEPIDNRLRVVNTPDEYERLQEHNMRPSVDSNKHWKRVVTKIQDNPFFFDVRAWQYVKEGEDYMAMLGQLPGYLFKQWVLGEWTAAEGGVFPEFSTANVVKPHKIPSHWPRIMVYDPGHGHPTGIAWVAITPTGKLLVYDEIHTPGYALADFANWIKEKEEAERRALGLDSDTTWVRRLADPRGAFSSDAKDPRSIADIMAEDHGLVFDPWPSLAGPRKQAGVEALRQVVKDQRLIVFDTCKATINEFQSWRYKRNAAGEMRQGDDAYEDANNEIMDGLVGLLASNPSGSPSATVLVEASRAEDQEGAVDTLVDEEMAAFFADDDGGTDE